MLLTNLTTSLFNVCKGSNAVKIIHCCDYYDGLKDNKDKICPPHHFTVLGLTCIYYAVGQSWPRKIRLKALTHSVHPPSTANTHYLPPGRGYFENVIAKGVHALASKIACILRKIVAGNQFLMELAGTARPAENSSKGARSWL